MGDHLGVGLADEVEAVGLQLASQGDMVLDHPVMDDRDRGVAAANVRMGVAVGRRPVGRPASVSDAAAAGVQLAAEVLLKHADPAGALVNDQAVAVQSGDAGTVISAVLQAVQARQQDRASLIPPGVSNYPTHYQILIL